MATNPTEDPNLLPAEVLSELSGNANSQFQSPEFDKAKATKHVSWGGENKQPDKAGQEDVEEENDDGAVELAASKKKKAKRKPKSQRGKVRSMGFSIVSHN